MARFTNIRYEQVGDSLWEVRIPKKDGGYETFRGDKWQLEYKVERWLRKNAELYANVRGGKRDNAGRKANKTEAQKITDIFDSVRASVAGAANISQANVMEEVAKEMLKKVFDSKGKYNVFSGNLDNAYQATVVQGRRIVRILKKDPPTKGNPFEPAPRGRKKRVKRLEKNHGYGYKYRYKKHYERENGYDDTGVVAGMTRLGGFGRAAGDTTQQSGIIIENTAPYAGAVQAKGYTVLPMGIERSYSGRAAAKQKQLMMHLTKKFLKSAKLI